MLRGDRLRHVLCPLLLIIVAIATPSSVHAQAGEQAEHATGLILDTEETLRNVPRAPVYRGPLPERVDLSPYFPNPDDQGHQGSCTAWAVGYAARAYYSVALENAPRNQKEYIPSPAYIYNSIRLGSCNAGSRIEDALKLLRDGGSLSLEEHPYRGMASPAASAGEDTASAGASH